MWRGRAEIDVDKQPPCPELLQFFEQLRMARAPPGPCTQLVQAALVDLYDDRVAGDGMLPPTGLQVEKGPVQGSQQAGKPTGGAAREREQRRHDTEPASGPGTLAFGAHGNTVAGSALGELLLAAVPGLMAVAVTTAGAAVLAVAGAGVGVVAARGGQCDGAAGVGRAPGGAAGAGTAALDAAGS